jgi:hypothetical protein
LGSGGGARNRGYGTGLQGGPSERIATRAADAAAYADVGRHTRDRGLSGNLSPRRVQFCAGRADVLRGQRIFDRGAAVAGAPALGRNTVGPLLRAEIAAIFPAFYEYSALLLVLLAPLYKHIHWPQAAAALLYVNNYYQAIFGDPGTGFSHTWSLGIEEQFYLLWPGLIANSERVVLLH